MGIKIKGQNMNRSTFRMIRNMNGSVFSKARYMNGVGFEHPYQNHPQVTHSVNQQTLFEVNANNFFFFLYFKFSRSIFHTGTKSIIGSIVYNRAIVYKRQKFLKI